jgi:hypothetical protein
VSTTTTSFLLITVHGSKQIVLELWLNFGCSNTHAHARQGCLLHRAKHITLSSLQGREEGLPG